jgi:hypothetical protein
LQCMHHKPDIWTPNSCCTGTTFWFWFLTKNDICSLIPRMVFIISSLKLSFDCFTSSFNSSHWQSTDGVTV